MDLAGQTNLLHTLRTEYLLGHGQLIVHRKIHVSFFTESRVPIIVVICSQLRSACCQWLVSAVLQVPIIFSQ